MISSLTEMLDLQNFGHMTTFTLQFESRDTIFVGDVMDRNYYAMAFFSKKLYFKNTWGSQFLLTSSKV